MWRIVESIQYLIYTSGIHRSVCTVSENLYRFENNIFTKRYFWMCFKPGLRKNKIDVEKRLQFFTLMILLDTFLDIDPIF